MVDNLTDSSDMDLDSPQPFSEEDIEAIISFNFPQCSTMKCTK